MRLVLVPLLIAITLLPVAAQRKLENRNDPQRLEWFRDQGFGLFIHWTDDGLLGGVISHSLAGASEDYIQRYEQMLPGLFNPRKFHPQDWAALAKLAGIRYVVFTAKHHNGFCMFETKTTDYGVMNTPFRRDLTKEILAAFQEQGIAPGLYFSPDDFHWLHQNGKTIQRGVADIYPANNPGLMALDKAQVRELMTQYGPVDVIFFDGEAEGLRDVAWEVNPKTVVTRGAIETPEQYIPGVPLQGAWEANLTMGNEWPYKPTNDNYKSGTELISTLIETRAKGGNLLLNIGPKPDGEMPIQQEDRLREIGMWMFVNGEAIHEVRPWVVTNENDYWFTKKKDEDTLYVFVKEPERWKLGEWKDIVLRSVESSAETKVTVLSQNDLVLEYQPGVVPKTTWKQSSDGFHIRAMRAQRLYTDRKWPNPVVLKITGVKPAMTPPKVETTSVRYDAVKKLVAAEGSLLELGKAASVGVGFQYKVTTGMDTQERSGTWVDAGEFVAKSGAGSFSRTFALKPGFYDVRAVCKHPLMMVYGAEQKLQVK
ncbi:MAG: alpha-L-fucosidase [Bryobacteraceae bacterium]